MGGDDPEATIELVADTSSTPAARRFLERCLAEWGCNGRFDQAALLTSELVTNAVLHARSPVHLRVRLGRDVLRVEVTDRSNLEPVVRRVGPTSTRGRGMYLVSTLSRSWGVDGRPEGKTVWFEVDP